MNGRLSSRYMLLLFAMLASPLAVLVLIFVIGPTSALSMFVTGFPSATALTEPRQVFLPVIFTPAPAFPGAAGRGAQAFQACARSQLRIVEVTNLDNSGPGSLREALVATGPRVVVFKVAGMINLASAIDIRDDKNNSCLIVAGQTAPGGGIL